MEEKLAILMADLSGYTAMTEAHGPASAADLIDKYLEIVESSLTGDCKLHERTGDEVMIISCSPDDLLATTLLLIDKTSTEENFLQLHGGLHFGTVLKRRSGYFGTALNMTARITSTAGPGTFRFSSDFINGLSNPGILPFHPVGTFTFKNLVEEKELFEISFRDKLSIHIDPVCKMFIRDCSKAITHPEIENIYFCSHDCMESYSRQKLPVKAENSAEIH